MRYRPLKHVAILGLAFASISLMGVKCELGLKPSAFIELHNSNVDKYVGDFTPSSSVPAAGGWVKHTFDTAAGDGPLCIDGSPFTVFTRARNPFKLVIYLNGGGACWQNFYFCSTAASADPPGPVGIFGDSFDPGTGAIPNPLADYSMMYVSYCDGSVFTGDNTLADPSFTAGGGTRHHRGLRNLTAAMDLARAEFPFVSRAVVSGSSAGGFGVAAYAPFVFRFVFGNLPRLLVLNDSGPAVANLSQTTVIQTRANDWQNTQFIPASCTDCTLANQPAELIEWLFENDVNVRESLYTTDADSTIRFFLSIPTQEGYRSLLLNTHDPIVAEFPDRYRRYIRSGSNVHTILGGSLFYTAEIDGVPFHLWVRDFVNQGPLWVDTVQALIPSP
jgi:hypothetical protein